MILFQLSSNSSSTANHVSKTKLSVIWHMRLGHASPAVINKIDAISFNASDNCNKPCPVCPIAKQCKLSFSTSSSCAQAIFDLIHIDLWGPYHVATSHGCKYFLTIVDDHSRATWTFLLPTK